MSGLSSGSGTECNRVRVGGTTTLFGDPNVKPEKPYTIIRFPGGDVEISRCEDGRYWVHVAVREEEAEGLSAGRIVDARVDFTGRYADTENDALADIVCQRDAAHIAFLIEPGSRA